MADRARPTAAWMALSPMRRRAWYGFLRAHAAVVRQLDAELQAEHGLPLTSYDVLIHLAIADCGELQMSRLADEVVLSPSGCTRLVDRLEQEGLVERRRGDRDSRAVLCSITERGRARLEAVAPTHIQGVRERFLDRLSDQQAETLAAVWGLVLGNEDGPRRGDLRAPEEG